LKFYEIQGNAILLGDLAIMANAENLTAFIYTAQLNRTFSTLNFDDELLQFNLVKQWALENDPKELSNAVTLDFDSVLPAYYKTGNDAYSFNNDAYFSSASTFGACTFMVAAVVAALL